MRRCAAPVRSARDADAERSTRATQPGRDVAIDPVRRAAGARQHGDRESIEDGKGRARIVSCRMHPLPPFRSTAARIVALLVFGGTLTTSLTACESITGSKSRHPLQGMYELTTLLDTFSFETSPYMVPGCEGASMYCTLRRPMSDATLGGTMGISGGPGPSGAATARLNGRFCDAYDWQVPSGCARLGPLADRDYPYGSVNITRLPGSDPDSVEIRLGDEGPIDQSMPKIYLFGRRVGRDIVGRVYWARTINRSPPSHRGTFVARLREWNEPVR